MPFRRSRQYDRPVVLNPHVPPVVILSKSFEPTTWERPVKLPQPRLVVRPGNPTRTLQKAQEAPREREVHLDTPKVFQYPEAWTRTVNWWAMDGQRTLGK